MNTTKLSAYSPSSSTINDAFSNSTSLNHPLNHHDQASPELSWIQVEIGLGFILFSVGVSSILRLGIGSALLIAALRCMGQLAVVAQLFRVVLDSNNPWLVAGLTCIIKYARNIRSRFPIVFLAMISSSVPISILGAHFSMKVRPFWRPSEYIPILGMLCGATISSVVVATSCIMKEFSENKDRVELLLAFGASRSEACKHIIRQALKLSLMPVINKMSVIGIIAIPGMMTGAILRGSPIAQAAKLQMIIMFMISAATVLACVIVSLCAVRVVVDGEVRVRSERVWSAKKNLEIVGKVGEKVKVCAQYVGRMFVGFWEKMRRSAKRGNVEDLEEKEEEGKLLP
ncbi:hypothetical protein BDQ17DRAFT_1361029 [Cyathus striatus]|nr:hypothetical protein BDQ17DRAFT_1361029 [Cyathus striatus]